jgi:tetratricopeptide (TPR) repeat protein
MLQSNRLNRFLRYPELWILIVAVAVFWPLRHVLSAISPFPVVILGLAIFIVPGSAIVCLIGHDGYWWERLAAAFLVSLAIPGLISQAAIIFHTDIVFVLWGFLLLTISLVVVAFVRCWRSSRVPGLQGSLDRPPIWLWVIFGIMLSVVAVFQINSPVDGDAWDAQAYIQNIRYDSQIMIEEPKLNDGIPLSPRFYFSTWLVDQALMSYITELDPVDQFQPLRLPIMLISLVAFFSLARRVTGRRDAAAFTTIIWCFYLITSNFGTVAGYEVVVRPDLDKVIAGYIVLPLSLAVVLDVFDRRLKRDWAWLVICGIAGGITHPVAGALIGLSLIGFSLAELITQRNRSTIWRLTTVAAILMLAVVPSLYIFYRMSQEPDITMVATGLTDTRDPALAKMLRATLDRQRIWILDNGDYFMHPRIILQVINIPALLGLPFLFIRMRTSRAARLLFGMLTVITLLVLIPATAVKLGELTSLFLFYRLHWPISIAAVLTLGWGTWALMHKFIPPRRHLPIMLIAWLLTAAITFPAIRNSFMFLFDNKNDYRRNFCVHSEEIFRPFKELVTSETVVLADPDVNYCLAGYAPYTAVMEWRNINLLRNYIGARREAEGWQRFSDMKYYAYSEFVDHRLLEIIDRWGIGYIVVRLDSPLEPQLRHMPDLFQPVYSAVGRNIYRVLPTVTQNSESSSSSVIEANSLLTSHQWQRAIDVYPHLLTSEDDHIRYLAAIGLGRAYLQMGRVGDAFETWQMAAQYPGEALPWGLLGEVYALQGDLNEALFSYQQAIAIQPDNLSYQVRLGDLYYASEQFGLAEQAFSNSALIMAPPDSSNYFKYLGEAWLLVGDYDAAVEAFQRGAGIYGDLDLYIKLGQTYRMAQRWEDALATYQGMIRRDRWDEAGHLGLGQVLEARGDHETALQEIRMALRLNPLAIGAYQALATILQQQQGTPTAINQLQGLVGTKLGFGEALLATAVLQARTGNFNEATIKIEDAIEWDRQNIQYYNTAAGLQLTIGNLDEAIQDYRAILAQSSSDVAAHLGLARARYKQGDPASAEGYLYQAMIAMPYDVRPNLGLAEFYEIQGDPERSLAQFDLALTKSQTEADVRLALGRFLLRQGKFDFALENFQSVLDVYPETTAAYLGIGSAHQSQGLLSLAHDAFTTATQLRPGEGANPTALAGLLVQELDVEGAMDQLTRAIEIDPGYRFAYLRLGEIYQRLGHISEAENAYEQLIDVAPLLEDGYLALGQLNEAQGDQDEAIEVYQQALEHVAPSGSGRTTLALANIDLRRGNSVQAREGFQLTINHQPTLAAGYVALSAYHSQLGDFPTAKDVLLSGLGLIPGSAELNQALAVVQLGQGRVGEAEKTYRNALVASPTAFDLVRDQAILYASMGEPQQALAEIEAAIQHSPGNPTLLNWKSILESNIGEPYAALSTALQLTALAPGNAQSWITLGQSFEALGQFTMAHNTYRMATRIEPGNYRGWVAFGRFLIGRGEIDSAMEAMQEAIKANQGAVDPRLVIAWIFNREGRVDEALAEYSEVAELDNTQISALLAISQIYRQRGDFQAALGYLEQATAISPIASAPYQARSEIYLLQGEFDKANEELQAAASIAPGNCQAFHNLGDYLAGWIDWGDALTAYEQALALPGCGTSTLVALGKHHLIRGEPQFAIQEFEQAITAYPGDDWGYIALAEGYEVLAQPDQAMATYEEALVRVPASSLLKMAISRILTAQGRLDEGLMAAQESVQLAPYNPFTLITVGEIYKLLGEFAQAELNYQLALEIDQTTQYPYLNLGNLYAQLARFDQANAAYESAVDRAPTDPRGYIALANFMSNRGQLDDAVGIYEQGVEADKSRINALLSLGQLYQSMGRFAESENAIRLAIEIGPKETTPFSDPAQFEARVESQSTSTQAFVVLGDWYRNQNNWNAAEETYLAAIEDAPGVVDGYLSLATFYHDQGRNGDALAMFEKAIEVAPASALAYIGVGDWYRSQADLVSAEAAYQEATQVAPGNIHGYIGLGVVYQLQGRSLDVLNLFEQAVEVSPASPTIYVALGDWYRSQANLDAAEAAYMEAIEIGASFSDAYISLGNLYQARGQRGEALATFERNLEIAPMFGPGHIALGDWYRLEADWEAAEQAYQVATEVAPFDLNGYLRLGEAYMFDGKPHEAFAQLSRAIAFSPGHGLAHVALGDWFVKTFNFVTTRQVAESALEDAIEGLKETEWTGDPDEFLEYLALGWRYLKDGKEEEAFEYFEAAIELEPNSVLPYIAMGEWYRLAITGLPAAEKEYQFAIEVAPGEALGYIHLGRLYQTLGRQDEALAQFEAAVEIASGSSLGYVALGDWYRAQYEWEQAEGAYQKAIELNPGFIEANIRLGEVYLDQGYEQKAIAQFEAAVVGGLASEVIVCSPGRLPNTPSSLNSDASFAPDGRFVGAWRCEWENRPWSISTND